MKKTFITEEAEKTMRTFRKVARNLRVVNVNPYKDDLSVEVGVYATPNFLIQVIVAFHHKRARDCYRFKWPVIEDVHGGSAEGVCVNFRAERKGGLFVPKGSPLPEVGLTAANLRKGSGVHLLAADVTRYGLELTYQLADWETQVECLNIAKVKSEPAMAAA